MSESAATLNQWGEIFWSSAWPMLWQSSLLIAAVFVFDFVFARRIRASVRYVLWAVVLVKLILPPSLALPTSATWWLWRAQPATTSLIQNYTVSYDNTLSDAVPLPAAPVVSPLPKLSGEAWMLVAVAVMAVGLLLWLVFRWLGVAGKVRRSLDASMELNGILDDVRQLAGLRRRPRLKLIDETQSPAVYGLFRPVILLPKTLASRLSVDQIRAVLLHEVFHLRRGDVWVNCAQTLLQIAYWWHPLVWLANARLRRVREEAVDDSVMLALREGADSYAPTLLEVAKFAFRRPLTSLGLIGILESRSALRQRVERLVDFRPPRRVGVTFLSLCGVFAFCAVALPMGQGPAVDEPTAPPSTENVPIAATQNTSNETAQLQRKALSDKLNGIHLRVSYENQPLNQVLGDLNKRTVEMDPDKKGINFLFNPNVEVINPNTGLPLKENAAPKMVDVTKIKITLILNDATLQDILTAICMVSDHPIQYSVQDFGVVFSVETTNFLQTRTFIIDPAKFYSEMRDYVVSKATQNGIPKINELPMVYFSMLGVKFSSPKYVYYNERVGILFAYATPQDLDIIERAVFKINGTPDGEIRWPKSIDDIIISNSVTEAGSKGNADDPALANENAVSKQADSALSEAFAAERKAAHMDYDPRVGKNVTGPDFERVLDDPLAGGKIFTTPPSHFAQATGLEIRTFAVNPSVFFANLDKGIRSFYPVDTPTVADDVVPRLQQFLLTKGVDLGPPKQLFYNEGLGVIFVSATPQDLDVIEKSIQALSEYPPMLHIKSRFIEVPRTFFSSATANALPPGMTNGGILTETEMKNVWRLLSSQQGSEELAEPEVTTISGRQTEMRATIAQEVITNFTLQPLAGAAVGSKLVPQSERVETGSILDVVPDQLGDSYTINLTTIATQIDFLGYRTSNGLVRNVASSAVGTGVLPVFQVRDASMSRNLWDQQTLVLFPKAKAGWSHVWGEKGKEPISETVGATEENGDKVLVVLTTATMIDAAGNRIHSDYELPFAQNAVPRQSR